MKNKNQPNITLKIFLKNGKVKRVESKKKGRIYYHIQTTKESEVNKYYIRVRYGLVKDVFNKKVPAINEGEYFTRKELKHALKCFTE